MSEYIAKAIQFIKQAYFRQKIQVLLFGAGIAIIFLSLVVFTITRNVTHAKNASEVKGIHTNQNKEDKKTEEKPTDKPILTPTKSLKPTPTFIPTATPITSKPTTTSTTAPNFTPTSTPKPTETPSPTSAPTYSVDTGHLPTLGNNDAKVTIVEFSDFQCPYCQSFQNSTFGQIKNTYIDTGKVKFAYRHFPLSKHANAQKAAEASECANDQGKFWDYHDKLFATQSDWEGKNNDDAIQAFTDLANQIGIDGSIFNSCVISVKHTGDVNADSSAGQSIGVSGTPSFFINGQIVSGAQPFDTFKTIIDQELAK